LFVTGKSENWTRFVFIFPYVHIFSYIFIYFPITLHLFFTLIFQDPRGVSEFPVETRPFHWVLAVLKGWGARGVRGSVGCPAWVLAKTTIWIGCENWGTSYDGNRNPIGYIGCSQSHMMVI